MYFKNMHLSRNLRPLKMYTYRHLPLKEIMTANERQNFSNSSVWGNGLIITQTSFQAANSSVWPLHGHSSTARRFFLPTSQPPISTVPRPKPSWNCSDD